MVLFDISGDPQRHDPPGKRGHYRGKGLADR
jgi:hypothetical protein